MQFMSGHTAGVSGERSSKKTAAERLRERGPQVFIHIY